jgi:hypothetical protein
VETLPAAAAAAAPARTRLLVAGAALGWLALWAPGLAAGIRPAGARAAHGVGLGNLLLYAGVHTGWQWLLALAVSAIAAVAGLCRGPGLDLPTRLLLAATLSLIAVWVAPGATPHALALPLALLALAAAVPLSKQPV